MTIKKYPVNLKIIFINLFIILLFSCNLNWDSEKILNSTARAVFIEASTLDDGPHTGRGGDVYIIDLINIRKYRVTNDLYLNVFPRWNDEGNSVIYVTNRKGISRWSRYPFSDDFRNKLYEFNLNNNNLQRIELDYDSYYPHFMHYPIITCIKSVDNNIYFVTIRDQNKIFKLSDREKPASIFIELRENIQIFNFNYLNQSEILIIEYLYRDSGRINGGILLYDTKYDRYTDVVTDSRYELGGISKDGSRFIYHDLYNLHEYNIEYNVDKIIWKQGSNDIVIKDVQYLDNDRIIFLVTTAEMQQARLEIWNIGIYDRTTDTFKYLTNERKWWTDLDVFIKE
jgi:hypothetical protein